MSTPAQQPNPYQQPAYPQQYGTPAPNPYLQQPFPAPGGTGGKRIPGWLLAVTGAVVASAVWATTLFVTGVFDREGAAAPAKPGFGGYEYEANLCGAAPLNAFRGRYSLAGADSRYTSQQEGLDQSYCHRDLKDLQATEKDGETVFVRTSAEWHRAGDPSAEFASSYWAYRDKTTDKSRYRYQPAPIDNLGDEAFLVTEYRGEGKDTVGSMLLAVRSGWFTFEMEWTWYGGGPDSKVERPDEKDLKDWLIRDTTEALAALKQKG
ncbi:hypothetical protein [Streptomyces sp. CB03238]|uniref:hypothetical protein n=1 Tax=Streptomyces sp. CB03238 TaxID=1907777 RepID=UPI000A0F4D4A|nr:hypothetical protein [Streptomyces sp. CB03238]ORT58920.1 hypothetical protein BKD26_17325 [Streptomyces sp. CB03238]